MIPRAIFLPLEFSQKLVSLGYVDDNPFFAALEIIDQMPEGTHIKKNLDGLWYVWFNLTSGNHEFRHDKCPHVAAVKAFIGWRENILSVINIA